MTTSPHQIRFPGESERYRLARNKLLEAELELRQRLEEVASLRRKLPPGGKIKEDYLFEEINSEAGREVIRQTKLSGLFAPGKDSLILYSFMYDPAQELPCPMCTSFLDGLDGYVPHITQRVNLAIAAKAPIGRIREWAAQRGWHHLRLLSSGKSNYNVDYFAETAEGEQIPACNVFRRTETGIYHFYSTEMLYVPVDGHPRHVDLLWPIWNFFDLVPEGRGTDWMPKLRYD